MSKANGVENPVLRELAKIAFSVAKNALLPPKVHCIFTAEDGQVFRAAVTIENDPTYNLSGNVVRAAGLRSYQTVDEALETILRVNRKPTIICDQTTLGTLESRIATPITTTLKYELRELVNPNRSQAIIYTPVFSR